MQVDVAELEAWATSGAMMLTGPANAAPSAAPAWLASAMAAAADDLATQTTRWGRRVLVDGAALLGERAAITGMTRNGSTSVGGTCRFLRAADAWVAVNLPRAEDVASMPALVEEGIAPDDWPALLAAFARMPSEVVVDRATMLGMAVGVAAARETVAAPSRELFRGGRRRPKPHPLVIDLGSLWAGPLAGGLLREAGARVIKVEGRGRKDGARDGAVAFFDILNAGKECLEIDFRDREDRRFLSRLLRQADLVIEASRPRVMSDLGVDPEDLADSGVSWLSLTAHGRTGREGDRVGFGDDAAVSGGLFVESSAPADREPAAPMFVADAAADPLTGLVGAALGAELLSSERASVVEVPLARAARWAARGSADAKVRADGAGGWTIDHPGGSITVEAPRHRPVPAAAPPVNAHGSALRLEFGRDADSASH